MWDEIELIEDANHAQAGYARDRNYLSMPPGKVKNKGNSQE